MTLPQISVRDYLELIPAFDGEPTKLATFIDACENVLPLMAPGNEPARIAFTMLHIRNKLVGKAANLLAARTFTTFPELKQLLIGLFGDQRNEESLLSDLNTLRQQSKETPLQFADRCIDIRCLLISKLTCQEISAEIRDMKTDLYNKFTLRAFLTGVNQQLSHLLRCRNPKTIEDAIQIVTDEENINYHRSKINNAPQINMQNRPGHQLRINIPHTRPTPNIPQQNTQHPSQNWTPRPFPPRQPFFQKPGPSQQRQFVPINQQKPNVFQPTNKPPTNKPTPMEIDSGRTRLSKQSQPPPRNFPPKPQTKWRSEELYNQSLEEVGCNSDAYSDYENPVYYEDENYDSEVYQSEDQENANFSIQASETNTQN